MSVAMDVTVTGLDDWLDRIPDGPARDLGVHNVLDKGRFEVQRNIMEVMPSLTGNSRRNTDTDIEDMAAHVTIRGGAVFAEFGAAPHQILPHGVALRFVMLGGANPAARLTGRARRGNESFYVFAFAVNHPGQAAQHFMQIGLDNAMPSLQSIMVDELAGMISG